MGGKNAVDLVFDNLAIGDVAAAVDLLSADAHVWHCFDRIAHDRAACAREWGAFVDGFPERRFTDVRSRESADGYVRQHVMTVRTASGARLSWHVCVVVVMEGDRIKRLDEYLDRAASFGSQDSGESGSPQ